MENQSRRRRITKSLAEAEKPKSREYVVWDTTIAGFGLRVRPTGSKSFIYVYRSEGGRKGKVRRMTLGGHADQARQKAKALSAMHHGDRDPAAEKALVRNASSVADVLDRFLSDHVVALKPKTAAEYTRIVERLLKPRLGGIAVRALTAEQVSDAYQDMRAKPTQAAAAIRVLSSAMGLAEEWGFRAAGSNPARIRLKGTRRRTRLFSDAEVSRLHKAIDRLDADGEIRRSVALGLRLLFATGCRAGEILSLQWQHIDLSEGVLRWPDSKTGYLEKPITIETKALLQRVERIVGVPWVCPSANHGQMRVETLEGGFEKVMAAADVPQNENATLHLIRHWFSSKTYNDKSIPLPMQMKIVGHASVATAMRYAHPTVEEIQKAAAGAAKRRQGAVTAAERRGKVVRLQGA